MGVIKKIKKFFNYCYKRTNPVGWLKKKGATLGNNVRIIGEFYAPGEPEHLTIGDNTWISDHVHIMTHDGSPMMVGFEKNGQQRYSWKFGSVSIGKNCFIGCHAIILPNVCIGDNTIIGAASVVTKSFPLGGVVIAGNPARIIETIDEYETKISPLEIKNPDLTERHR